LSASVAPIFSYSGYKGYLENVKVNEEQQTLVLPATVKMSEDGSKISLLTTGGDYVLSHLVDTKLWNDLSAADGKKITFVAKVIEIAQKSKISDFFKPLEEIKGLREIIAAMKPINKDSVSVNFDAIKEELITQSI
ncbi:MAG: hypothetical protein KAS13_09295, partial [Candidatus Omnitrophica bacterium]|nr:hypothetical protein [Candidatus Omnitrophota bacterium]